MDAFACGPGNQYCVCQHIHHRHVTLRNIFNSKRLSNASKTKLPSTLGSATKPQATSYLTHLTTTSCQFIFQQKMPPRRRTGNVLDWLLTLVTMPHSSHASFVSLNLIQKTIGSRVARGRGGWRKDFRSGGSHEQCSQ